jgi:hypothetical protein
MTAALRDAECAGVEYLPPCSEPRLFATGAGRQIAEATQLLLSALNCAVDDAARGGTTDTGARRAAAELLDARIAVLQAVAAAGRVLADRERVLDLPVTSSASEPSPRGGAPRPARSLSLPARRAAG